MFCFYCRKMWLASWVATCRQSRWWATTTSLCTTTTTTTWTSRTTTTLAATTTSRAPKRVQPPKWTFRRRRRLVEAAAAAAVASSPRSRVWSVPRRSPASPWSLSWIAWKNISSVSVHFILQSDFCTTYHNLKCEFWKWIESEIFIEELGEALLWSF